jgi:phosphoglycolate phosphatase
VDDKTLDVGISAFSAHYEEHCVDETVLYEGVEPLLAELSRTRQLGVVTNKPWSFADKILKTLGVAHSISALMGGDTFPERKPHPRPVFEAIKQLGGHAKTTLILGDGMQDIKAGQAAGIKTCAARYGYGFHPDLLTLKPDYVINVFTELKEIVK